MGIGFVIEELEERIVAIYSIVNNYEDERSLCAFAGMVAELKYLIYFLKIPNIRLGTKIKELEKRLLIINNLLEIATEDSQKNSLKGARFELKGALDLLKN